MVDWLTGWFTGWMGGSLDGRLASWLAGWYVRLNGFVGWLPFNWFGCLTGWFPDGWTSLFPITNAVFCVHNLPSWSQSKEDENINLQNLSTYTRFQTFEIFAEYYIFNEERKSKSGYCKSSHDDVMMIHPLPPWLCIKMAFITLVLKFSINYHLK
jgi:hypothetical protein